MVSRLRIFWIGMMRGYIFFQKKIRYIFAIVVLVFTAIVNVAGIAISPSKNVSTPKKETDSDQSLAQKADIDGEHPTKVYDRIMNAHAGDWYRVNLIAKAFDQEETLRVIVRSEFGKEKDIGGVSVPKDERDHYIDFTFKSDDAYRDVLIRKDKGDSDSKWKGGRVALNQLTVSRLYVSSDTQAQKLRPTVLGIPDVDSRMLPGGSEDKKVAFPKGSHFIFGRTFDVSEDRYLLSVTMNIKGSDRDVSGKYRLELHPYNPETKQVGADILKKNSFSLKDTKDGVNENGYTVFDFPVALKSDQSYFLGISDSQVSGAKNALQISDMADDSHDGVSGPAILYMAKPYQFSDGHRLLTNAKLEDLGAFSRYTYSMNHATTDMMDIHEVSGDAAYDESLKTVVGDEVSGTSFIYRVDTVRPFSLLRMEASQLGDEKGQIRMEYSYDRTSWTEIHFTQEDKGSQMFDVVLSADDQKRSVVYFRVSYADEQNGKGTFGLSDFRITANISNDVTR